MNKFDISRKLAFWCSILMLFSFSAIAEGGKDDT